MSKGAVIAMTYSVAKAGVAQALEILRADVERTLRLLGVRFDRRVGSFVRKCSPELGSQLNAERKNTLDAANAVPGF